MDLKQAVEVLKRTSGKAQLQDVLLFFGVQIGQQCVAFGPSHIFTVDQIEALAVLARDPDSINSVW